MALFSQPIADFTATPVQGCNPLKVDFQNKSTGAVSYKWFFGNGNSSTLTSPSAVYNTSGKFSVTLIAQDVNGQSDTIVLEDYITVFRTPKASFNVQKKTLCTGDSAIFTDNTLLGDGPIKTYKWDFGNGGTSALQNPFYVYNTNGTFDITFAVTDVNGCQSSIKSDKFISTVSLPTGDFTTSRPNFCKAPASVKFSGTAQGNGSMAYSWSFGDGKTGSGSVVDHMYNNLGAFTVTLNVTDGNGCVLKITKPAIIQIKEPTVDFAASLAVICAGQKVSFHNQSFPTDGSGRFHWDFGNGDTASAISPEVTYSKAGVYSVSLTYYWDNCVVTKTKTAYITVSNGAVGLISPRDTAFCRTPGEIFNLSTKGNGYNNVIWQLGKNKPVESLTFPFKLDTNIGTYVIRATFISNVGCKSSTDSTKITLRGPRAVIGIDKTSGCMPYNINAYSVSVSAAPIVKYQWTGIDQPVNSTASSVSFVNNKFGKSALQLMVTDVYGCSDYTVVLLGAGIPKPAKFAIDKKVICSNEPLTQFNLSPCQDPDTVIFLWSWTNNDTILYPPLAASNVVKFRTKPSKNVKLTFTANSFGCVMRDSLFLEVKGAYLDGNVKMLCEEDSLLATNKSIDYTSTFWKYSNENNTRITDNRLTWGRAMSKTTDIWLYAFNTINNCKDSMPVILDIDPQDASFDYTIDCGSGQLQTKNNYLGLKQDTLFEWTLTNTATNAEVFYKGKDFSHRISETGQFKLQLFVKNPAYKCTKPKVVYFTIRPIKNLRGDVTINRTTCYPVDFTLTDNNYKSWRSAKWIVDNEVELLDNVQSQKYTYISNKTDMEIYLVKADSLGCSYTDTFKFQIKGVKAAIGMDQDNTDCTKPILRFTASFSPVKPNTQYQFAWDFGYKKSTKYSDTVRTTGTGTVTALLTVNEGGGCKSIAKMEYAVKAGKPHAKFITHDTLTACPPLNINFIDQSTSDFGPITSRKWDFGDLSTSDKNDPGKLYVVPGKYTVSLIVTNTSNCSDTFSVSDLVVVKGPYGTYSIDKSAGCAPLAVKLNTSIRGVVAKFDFDMGDGNVFDQGVNEHMYTQAGTYIPRLILIDSAGCKYSPEPTDTIRVYPKPKAMFTTGPLCLNQIYKIPHTTICEDSVTVEWFHTSKKLSSSDTLALALNAAGQHDISLKVVTEHGCMDSTTKPFFGYGIYPKLSMSKEEYCLGDEVKIHDNTKSDTTLTERRVWLDDRLLEDEKPWKYVADTRGRITLNAEFTDALGCKTDFAKADFIKVGDTNAPPPLTLYRTSVVDDQTIETKFSASKEPDFKVYNLFIQDGNVWKPAADVAKLEDTILYTSGLNTLKNSYCHMILQKNFCGSQTLESATVKHCTIEAKAKGDTNVSIVNWTPYIGWQNVAAYRVWRKPRSEKEFTLISVVPGNVNVYHDSAVFCKMEYDFHIEGVEDGGFQQNSFSDTAQCKPIIHHDVPSPEIWRTTVENNLFVHTEFVMPKPSKYPVSYYSISRDGADFVRIESGKSHFDDYNVDVQHINYTYTVIATDICDFTSPISTIGRNIVLDANSVNETQDPKLSWTPYVYWNEGVQEYKIERSLSGSEFVEVGRVEGDELSFTDRDLPKHCEKNYSYRVVAIRNQPQASDSSFEVESVSNQYNFVPEIRFFIPNAFTPNNNNLNEGFHPDGQYFSGYEMKIYNRYGQKLYENSDCMNSWDGKYMNEDAPEGVYAYYIEAWDVAGKSYKFNGTIHLIR
ncbi:MAG: PKD domain-containing protein [Bacteroidetes bacterium]|nr:PKD domain-containing protein [Bacteroidota bacterium]